MIGSWYDLVKCLFMICVFVSEIEFQSRCSKSRQVIFEYYTPQKNKIENRFKTDRFNYNFSGKKTMHDKHVLGNAHMYFNLLTHEFDCTIMVVLLCNVVKHVTHARSSYCRGFETGRVGVVRVGNICVLWIKCVRAQFNLADVIALVRRGSFSYKRSESECFLECVRNPIRRSFTNNYFFYR